MAHRFRNADEVIARLGRRSSVLTRAQLLAAGVSHDQIAGRTRTGLLTIEYPGVYRLGPRRIDTEYLAAVRACGPRATLSGDPAAWWLNLIKGRPPQPEVSAPSDRRIEGLRTRRRRLDPSELTTHRGIPVTTVPLTLLDLSPLLAPEDLARACHEAGVRYRTTPSHVAQVLRTRSRREGGSTAAGPSTGSRSSSTPTAFTIRATPGEADRRREREPSRGAASTRLNGGVLPLLFWPRKRRGTTEGRRSDGHCHSGLQGRRHRARRVRP